jgi:hypothetical protein
VQRFEATNQAYWSVITLTAKDGMVSIEKSAPADGSPTHAGGVVFRVRRGRAEYLLVEASHQGWGRQRAWRSSSSSCVAGPPAAPTRTPWRAGVAPPGQTGASSASSPASSTSCWNATTGRPWRSPTPLDRHSSLGVFPNDAALLRLAGSLLIEQNDEWLVSRRYLSEASMAELATDSTSTGKELQVA